MKGAIEFFGLGALFFVLTAVFCAALYWFAPITACDIETYRTSYDTMGGSYHDTQTEESFCTGSELHTYSVLTEYNDKKPSILTRAPLVLLPFLAAVFGGIVGVGILQSLRRRRRG